MAGVYIKGENIPYGCAVCPCHNWEQGFCQVFDDFRAADDDQTRPDWCPLVEVPDHGDLIDRDVLMKYKASAYDINDHELYVVGTGTILRMPAVIPADREGE